MAAIVVRTVALVRSMCAVETHTIDFIPLAERYGKPWNLFTLWFGANTVMISIVTGALLVAKGVSFGWSVLAIVISFGLGAFLAAFHRTAPRQSA